LPMMMLLEIMVALVTDTSPERVLPLIFT
jgi:hypothetical protein